MQVIAVRTGDWAQLGAAVFTALTALAAFASVARVERDRWTRAIPDFELEIIGDVVNDEMRMTVANLGGPAREVRVFGTLGGYGWLTPTPPTAYWRAGESRTYRLAMPVVRGEVNAGVEARDRRKKQLVLVTAGGAAYRWPLRKAKKLSLGAEWERLFPGQPTPADVPKTSVVVELLEQNL